MCFVCSFLLSFLFPYVTHLVVNSRHIRVFFILFLLMEFFGVPEHAWWALSVFVVLNDFLHKLHLLNHCPLCLFSFQSLSSHLQHFYMSCIVPTALVKLLGNLNIFRFSSLY